MEKNENLGYRGSEKNMNVSWNILKHAKEDMISIGADI